MKIIGLVAPKSGGKDTVAALLKEAKKSHGKISFAGPLKQICSEVFDIPIQTLNDPVLKEKPFKEPLVLTAKKLREVRNLCTDILDTYDSGQILYNANRASIVGIENTTISSPRELMQVIGTDYIRERIFGEWHMRAAFSTESLLPLVKSGVYCVTDIRFLNEYEFLKERFGDDFVCYYVERPEAEEVLKTATHPSELEVLKIRELLSVDNIIKNNGSLKDLEAKVAELKLPEPKKPAPGSRFKFAKK